MRENCGGVMWRIIAVASGPGESLRRCGSVKSRMQFNANGWEAIEKSARLVITRMREIDL
jgi:hypothetical protein